MEALRKQHKTKPTAFGNVTESRYLRTKEYEESRRKERTKAFNKKRDMLSSPMNIAEDNASTSKRKDRYTRLQQWKADRSKRKQMEKMNKKPAFVVGVMHHKLYSPVNGENVEKSVPLERKVQKENLKKAFPSGITKATEKRLQQKRAMKSVVECSERAVNSSEKKNLDEQANKYSIIPNAHKFKAPAGIKPILFGRVAMESMSPNKLSKIMSFSPLIRKSGRKSNFMGEVTTEPGPENSKMECDALAAPEENSADDSEKESSAEEICLKLSSSEEDDKLTSLNSNNRNEDANSNNENETEARNNKTPNSSYTIATSQNGNEPAFYSPYIVSSRGKTNARKEQQLRRGFSLGRSSSNEIPTKDSVMTDLNISVEEEERAARYFRFLLNRETERLKELCERWREVKEAPDTTEDGQYQIQQAIGQTSLLINKKFERFRGLVLDCETGKGEMLVTRKDLQGFWDVICMEVRNCDSRFEKVEELRSRGWKELEEKLPSKPVAGRRATARKKVVAQKPSAIRAFLRERKKKIAKNPNDGDNAEHLQVKENRSENASNTPYKTRRSVSVLVNDKKVTPASNKKMRSSLLRKVQLSEARIKSPLTIIKISQMCKTPEVQLDDSITYVNSDQTPGKSILKQPRSSVKTSSCVKSACKVNFDDNGVRSAEIPVDEETQVKRDLAKAMARIDSLDFDNTDDEIEVHAEKKLLFNESSSEECKDVHDAEQNLDTRGMESEDLIKVPFILVQAPTPISRAASSSKRSLKRQDAIDEISIKHEDSSSDDGNEQNKSVRVLRTRTVTSVSTPQPKRKSVRKVSINVTDSESKENKTPSRTRRKSSVKVTSKDEEKINPARTLSGTESSKINNKRRQSAKAVKFSEKDCGICAEDNQIFSVTPHVNRLSKTPLREKRRSKFEETQTFSDITERPPGRIRRSQR